MISDLDIYRTANILVKQHGEVAPVEAAKRADAMLEGVTWKGEGSCQQIALATQSDAKLLGDAFKLLFVGFNDFQVGSHLRFEP